MKSKQISKIVGSTCFQRPSGVNKYADSEYDIFKILICIYLLSIGCSPHNWYQNSLYLNANETKLEVKKYEKWYQGIYTAIRNIMNLYSE